MDPKHLLIAHGEKAVVLIVAGVCAWVTITSFTDDSIRPKGVTSQTIDEHINAIDQRMQSKDVPTIKAAPAYLDSMKARFARAVPAPTRMSWLMSHTDMSGVGHGIYFYVYDLYQPTVTAKDNIGTVEITVQPPRAAGGGDRVSSEADRPWVRSTERTILNSAHLLGVQLEIQIGQGQWRPFKGPGVLDGGFIPLDTLRRIGGKLSMVAEAVWQRHAFRVRSVLKATGFTGEREDADETILVHDAHEKAFEAPTDWNAFYESYHSDPDGFLAGYMKGEKAPIAGVVLAKNEQLYLSDWNAPPEASVPVTAEVRFAFEKVATDPADPSKEVATFLLSKQFKGKAGTANTWLDKPELFKVAKGEVLGGPRDLVPPGGKEKRTIDLTTPFQLDEIKHDVDRIWYYELKVKPRTPPTKDKDLDIDPYTKKTDVAVLKNTKTGGTLELVRLVDVRRPNRAGVIYYPLYPAEIYEEDKEFQKSPAEFQQWGLKPPEPVKHPKDSGPLLELKDKTGDSIYSTDTDYIEMPDGRLYWWEPVNHKLKSDPPEKDETSTIPPAHGPGPTVPPVHPPAHTPAPPHTTPHPAPTNPRPNGNGPPPQGSIPQGMPPGLPPSGSPGGPPAGGGGYPHP